LRLFDIIWNERFAAKVAEKHGIITDEVEEILFSNRLMKNGRS